ncbi:MAG: 3'-5' exonuclease, partial [Rhodoferax sp.]
SPDVDLHHLVALLDVLVSPSHDLSLARVLKSPVFSLPDDALVALALHQRACKVKHPDSTWWSALQTEEGLHKQLQGIGAVLRRWQARAVARSPHDALSAIYYDGDVLAKYAAACPEGMRTGVLANLRALLQAALQVDGGRYTTAYNFVRAMRAGGIAAPQRADTKAVRLLTIHGAKGLEAPLVLMLDTDAEAPKTETMGVLVDWPGEHAYPRRFIFLASETRPPACALETLAMEQAARKREELNALYVALTRTQRTLVLSSMEPHREHPGSWWQRLHPHATCTVVAGSPAAGDA